jgi:hypothetical protein
VPTSKTCTICGELPAQGGDRRGHRLGVGPLVDRRHFIVGLQRVEIGGEFVDALEVNGGHRVPPLQFDRLGKGRADGRGKQRRDSGKYFYRHCSPLAAAWDAGAAVFALSRGSLPNRDRGGKLL